MAKRVFNNCILNGNIVSIGEMVSGSGEIILRGKDVEYTTDDHLMHNIRLNEYYTASLKAFGDRCDLETDAMISTSGGTHIFYLDDIEILRFDGLVSCEYDEHKRETVISIRGEAKDA